MTRFSQVLGQQWKGISLSCLLAVGAFLLGYWMGGRSPASVTVPEVTSNKITAPTGTTRPISLIVAPVAPGPTSPEMKEFLDNRAKLSESLAKLRSQGTNGAPNPQAFAEFQAQNKALLDQQRELAQAIAAQQAKNPAPVPPPLRMPANASPQLQAFLTARDQLMRDQAAFMNQHRTDDPQTRQVAIQQWRQQNEPRFVQLQQLAQAISKPTSAKTN